VALILRFLFLPSNLLFPLPSLLLIPGVLFASLHLKSLQLPLPYHTITLTTTQHLGFCATKRGLLLIKPLVPLGLQRERCTQSILINPAVWLQTIYAPLSRPHSHLWHFPTSTSHGI